MANKGAKIMASLGLIGILASVIGTGILYFVESRKTQENTEVNTQELQNLIKQIKTSSGETTLTGETLSGEIEVSTGEVELQK